MQNRRETVAEAEGIVIHIKTSVLTAIFRGFYGKKPFFSLGERLPVAKINL